MPKCSFCAKQVPKGKGKMFVFSNGKINYFCNSKCEKNQLKLKRRPRKLKWTEMYEKPK